MDKRSATPHRPLVTLDQLRRRYGAKYAATLLARYEACDRYPSRTLQAYPSGQFDPKSKKTIIDGTAYTLATDGRTLLRNGKPEIEDVRIDEAPPFVHGEVIITDGIKYTFTTDGWIPLPNENASTEPSFFLELPTVRNAHKASAECSFFSDEPPTADDDYTAASFFTDRSE